MYMYMYLRPRTHIESTPPTHPHLYQHINRYQPPLPTTIDAKDIDCSSPSYSDPGACTELYCHRQTDGIKRADRVREKVNWLLCPRI